MGLGKLHPQSGDAAMQNAVAIQLDMPKPVAEALLCSLRAELRRGLTEHWYDDRYRTVPEFQRSRRIPTRQRSSFRIASAGISHSVTSAQTPEKVSTYCPS